MAVERVAVEKAGAMEGVGMAAEARGAAQVVVTVVVVTAEVGRAATGCLEAAVAAKEEEMGEVVREVATEELLVGWGVMEVQVVKVAAVR